MQPGTSRADAAERPAHALANEVALIACAPFDEREVRAKLRIGRAFVVQCERCEQRERGALRQERRRHGPFPGLLPGERRAVEEVEARRVAVCPVLEAPRPAIHLAARDPGGVSDERGEEAGLVPPGLPELEGQFVIGADLLPQLQHLPHRDAEYLLRDDPVARHPIAIGARAPALEPGKDLVGGHAQLKPLPPVRGRRCRSCPSGASRS